MNGNDSGWLNDTLPENQNDSNNINSSSNSIENNEEINNQIVQQNENITLENNEEKLSIANKTLGDMAGKIKEEELSDDEKYLEEYIGKNYEKIYTKLLNFGALFFTYLYLFYRKMYFLGFITLLIQTVLVIYVNPYVSLVINVILFFTTNIIYTSHAKRKIESIKNKSGSKLKENLVNESSAKGGVSKKSVFLAIILGIAATIFISFKLRDQEPYSQIADFIDNKVEEVKYEIEELSN